MTQMVGRGLRGPRAGGTEFAYIVSFNDIWKTYIMWAVPETIYYDESLEEELPIDTGDGDISKEEEEQLICISQEKILEFAKIINDAINTAAISAIPFMERIPIGMYAFSCENKGEGKEDGSEISYQIMVYHSTKDAYENFMNALPELFQNMNNFGYEDVSEETLLPDVLKKLLRHCKENFSAVK